MNLTVCPGTLRPGFDTYSPACQRRLFGGRKVSHLLPFDPPGRSEQTAEAFVENRKRISLSGVQEKLSMVLDGNELRLTQAGEGGTYMLKPIPRDVRRPDQAPANEHLSMQIAEQVYGLQTAANALVFFADGTPAYLTLRFDRQADGSKWASEDFAVLAGKTSMTAGPNFKYDYSYEEMGQLLPRFVPAWRVEIERLFQQVVFNYLFSNGDAHLKNFSLLQSPQGDHLLSPAYDLLNTRLHVDDTDFAVELFVDNFKSAQMQKRAKASQEDFRELARRWQMLPRRTEKMLKSFLKEQPEVAALIERSFLDQKSKHTYLQHYQTKRNLLLG